MQAIIVDDRDRHAEICWWMEEDNYITRAAVRHHMQKRVWLDCVG